MQKEPLLSGTPLIGYYNILKAAATTCSLNLVNPNTGAYNDATFKITLSRYLPAYLTRIFIKIPKFCYGCPSSEFNQAEGSFQHIDLGVKAVSTNPHVKEKNLL